MLFLIQSKHKIQILKLALASVSVCAVYAVFLTTDNSHMYSHLEKRHYEKGKVDATTRYCCSFLLSATYREHTWRRIYE